MLSMNEIRSGVIIELKGEPWQVLEAHHLKVAQRRPVMQTKLRNLVSGKILEETFQQSDRIPEANVEKMEAKFTYRTRDRFFFTSEDGRKFDFGPNDLAEKTGYLTKDLPVQIVLFKEKPISIDLPIKVSLKVKDAPPAARGDTVQGGLKDVTLETGAIVRAPLFVEEGDTLEIDTRDNSYVRRV